MKSGQRSQKLKALPVYRRIEQDIQARIRQGNWAAGMAIPSRLKLVEDYGVSLPTIEHAIDLLIADGLLYAEARRKTFVAVDAQARLLAGAGKGDDGLESADEVQDSLASGLIRNRERAPILGIIPADYPVEPHHPNAEFDWSSRVIRAMERTISLAGGRSYFQDRFDGPERVLKSLEESILSCILRGVDALAIVNVVDPQSIAEKLSTVIDPGTIPVIVQSWEAIADVLPHISYDNRYAGEMAALHLLEMGYWPLVFLNCWGEWWADERLLGIQVTMSTSYPEADRLIIQRPEAQPTRSHRDDRAFTTRASETGYSEGIRFFAGYTGETQPGIIAPNDWVAHGVLRAAQVAGMQAGRDFGLVGFDNVPVSSHLGLTSISPPFEELGREAVSLLLQGIQGEPLPVHMVLKPYLVLRASTDNRPRKAYVQALTPTLKTAHSKTNEQRI